MKGLLNEFKAFLARGSVLDLAVGVIIGAAFKAIVDSLVNDLLSPVIGLLADDNFANLSASIGGVTLRYGAFFTAVINFFITALALFLIVKSINRIHVIGGRLRTAPAAVPTAPAVKACPYCRMEIPLSAVRCGHCASDLQGTDIGPALAAQAALAAYARPGAQAEAGAPSQGVYRVSLLDAAGNAAVCQVNALTGAAVLE